MARVLITGANRGIGLELVKCYVERGDKVIAVCRKPSEALCALQGGEIIDGVELSSSSAVKSLSSRVSGKVDILINNAGLLVGDNLDTLDFSSVEEQFKINALAPLAFAKFFKERLSGEKKFVVITSRMGSVADNSSGAQFGYRMSKAALNAASKSLSIDLRSFGISVGIFHPGYVKTGMTNYSGNLEPENVARSLVKRIDKLSLESSGKFIHSDGSDLPW